MDQVIQKFSIDIVDTQYITLTAGYQILCAQVQNGYIRLWVLLDRSAGKVQVPIYIAGTGREFTSAVKFYLGTVQLAGLVWHIFHGPCKPYKVKPAGEMMEENGVKEIPSFAEVKADQIRQALIIAELKNLITLRNREIDRLKQLIGSGWYAAATAGFNSATLTEFNKNVAEALTDFKKINDL